MGSDMSSVGRVDAGGNPGAMGCGSDIGGSEMAMAAVFHYSGSAATSFTQV